MKKYMLLALIGVFAILGAYFLGEKGKNLDATKTKAEEKATVLSENKNSQEGSLYGKKNRFGYIDIDSDTLASAMKNKDFVLINVHIPYQGEIARTDKFIPYNKIAKNKDLLPKDKSAKIVLYCLAGGMSSKAARDLKLLGYENVYNLKGGMISWKEKGYEVIIKN